MIKISTTKISTPNFLTCLGVKYRCFALHASSVYLQNQKYLWTGFGVVNTLKKPER